MAHELGNRDLCLVPLTALAQMALQTGRVAAAASLSTFAADHPLAWWETRQAAQHILAEALARLDDEERERVGERGRNITLETALDFVQEQNFGDVTRLSVHP